MKICHFTNYWPELHDIWGGAERACQRTVDQLSARGIINEVFTLPAGKKPPSGVNFISTFEDILPGWLKRICRNFKLLIYPFDPHVYFSCLRFLRQIKPDVVHLHNANILSFAVLAAAKTLRIPVVQSIYDYWFFCPQEMLMKKDGGICQEYQGACCADCYEFGRFGFIKKLLIKFRKSIFDHFLRQIDSFLVLSESSKIILIDYGIKNEKIEVIRQPVNVEAKQVDYSQMQKGLILFVGWKTRRKGLHILLQALKQLPEAKLVAIGKEIDADYLKMIKDYIADNGLGNKVDMLTRVSQEELENYWRKANVVVVPEQWENMSPLVLLEAMSFGRAIVASWVGGLPEFIEDGKSGLLAQYNDPADFAAKISRILKEPALAENLGRKAQEQIASLGNVDRFVGQQVKLYEKVILNAQ